MRSKYGWTTSYHINQRGKAVPACLFRNAVKLHHPKRPIEIIFLHAITHFEVYLAAPQADLPSICAEVRDMLVDAVSSAGIAFRYKSVQAAVAFQCPCGPFVHTAIPNDAHSKLICTLTGVSSGPLSSGQKVWLGSKIELAQGDSAFPFPFTASGPPSPPPSQPSRMNEQPTFPELLRLRVPQTVGENYFEFGIFLLNDETGYQVGRIEDEYRGKGSKIVRKILQEWLEGKGTPVSWKTLVHTLRDSGLSALADEIRQELRPDTLL
jgi:hypothetical protein